jgi:predicted nucleotide-binding protein (sugar kinase/HSP70/actin superfamily)
MKVTFPHMGNMYIPVKVLLDTAGIEYVMPPLNSKKLCECAIKHSPEFACLPFKTILGDFIYGLENGADFILFGGGRGQCRLGYYGDLQAEILKSMNYRVEFVCLDLTNLSVMEVLHRIKPLVEGKSILKILKGIIDAVRTVYMADQLNKFARFTRCREIHKGQTDRVLSQFHTRVQKTEGYKNIKALIFGARKAIKQIKLDKGYNPIKISLVGEMYACAHPGINFEVEKKLGNMGVEVYNNLSVSHWITEYFIKKLIPVRLKNKSLEAGREFIGTDDIGGHGIHTVGNCILSAKNKLDGVIHIYPFTCMPEIVAQCAFNEIQSKYGIPIMTLIIDEMTGEASYITRLEAFVDLLEMKRMHSVNARLLTNSD